MPKLDQQARTELTRCLGLMGTLVSWLHGIHAKERVTSEFWRRLALQVPRLGHFRGTDLTYTATVPVQVTQVILREFDHLVTKRCTQSALQVKCPDSRRKSGTHHTR